MCQIQSPTPKIIKSPTYSEITHVWQYFKPCVYIYQTRNKNQKGQKNTESSCVTNYMGKNGNWKMYLKMCSS